MQSNQMLADCLTKVTKSGEDLVSVLRQGVYHIPGGVNVRDSTLTAVKTWRQLVEAEKGAIDEDETAAIVKVDKEIKEKN